MPDATGTATSPDLIPTYNTAVDPPSGKGLNTVVAAIQTALTNSYIRKPASIAANEVPVWNGSTWIRSSATRIINGPTALPNITTSAFAGGPPGSPTDGDIWIASGAGAAGEVWQFRFNAGSASAFKWEFIGGPEVVVTDDGSVTTTSGPYAVPTAGTGSQLTLTASRAGDYIVGHSGYMSLSVAGNPQVGLRASGTPDVNLALSGAGMSQIPYGAEKRMNGVTAVGTIQPIVAVSTGTGTYQWRTLWCRPIRVS